MGFFDSIFDDSSDSDSGSSLWDEDDYSLFDSGDVSGEYSLSDSLGSTTDSWGSSNYDLDSFEYKNWDSMYGDAALNIGSGDDSWLDKVGGFLGSSKGLGFIGGLGNAGLKYMTADQQAKTQFENQMKIAAKNNEYAMALLKLKDEIADGNRSSGGGSGGSGGGDTGTSGNDAAIKALADKYPSDPNFKRS